MTRTIAVLTVGLLTVVAATAQPPTPSPPSVRLYVEAEVTGVVKEWERKLYVLAEPNAEQARRIKEIDEAPAFARQNLRETLMWPRMWRIDLAKLDKAEVTKLVGKKVEAVGKAPLYVIPGGAAAAFPPGTSQDAVIVDKVLVSAKLTEVLEKK